MLERVKNDKYHICCQIVVWGYQVLSTHPSVVRCQASVFPCPKFCPRKKREKKIYRCSPPCQKSKPLFPWRLAGFAMHAYVMSNVCTVKFVKAERLEDAHMVSCTNYSDSSPSASSSSSLSSSSSFSGGSHASSSFSPLPVGSGQL